MNYPDCKPGCGWFDCAYCRDGGYARHDNKPPTSWEDMESEYGPMHLQPKPGGPYDKEGPCMCGCNEWYGKKFSEPPRFFITKKPIFTVLRGGKE